MKNSFVTFSLLIPGLVIGLAQPVFADGSSSNPIVGSWTWTRDVNNCTEVYTYNADGTEHVVSGDEVSDAKYTISNEASSRGFYKLIDKVVKDYGGKDCGDDESDSTGQEATNFLIFNAAKEKYFVCETESMDRCFGPLTRMKTK
jgi:hypothetical protein